MKLRTIIESKIDSLYTTYDKVTSANYEDRLNEAKKDLSFASKYLDDISKDISNIIQLETDAISHIVSESNWEMINELISNIKLVYEAKSAGINIDLTDDQKEFLSKFIVSLQERIEELKRAIAYYTNCMDKINYEAEKIENDIDDLEGILIKISAPEKNDLLTKEDFAIIHRIFIEDASVSNTLKKNVLKEYIKFNSNLLDNIEINEKQVDISEVKKLLSEYGVHDETIKKISKYKKEIESSADLDKMREILEYLTLNDELTNKVNFVNSFNAATLFSILLCGDVEYIRDTYNYQMNRFGHLVSMFLKTPSVWVNNIPVKRKRKKPSEHGPRDNGLTLHGAAHETSIKDMILNENFLRSKGFNVSLDDDTNVKTLKSRHYLIRDNYDIFVNYGVINPRNITDFSLSTLSFSNTVDHLDNLIEIGLLDDSSITNKPQNNYVSMYPTIIQNATPEHIMFFYKLKSSMPLDEYYDLIFSKNKNGMLARTTIETMMKNEGLNAETKEEYHEKNFVSLKNIIPKYDEYVDCIYGANLIIHDNAILNDPLIQMLESKYKVTDYSYLFGNQIISRFKVLRNFSALRKFGYIDEEALLFCITYNSYLNGEALDMIRSSLSINGGRK